MHSAVSCYKDIFTLLDVCFLSGAELSGHADRRGVSSPFVSAGFVWAVRQSVYASNRSRDVTNTSLGAAINDLCHFLLSKVSPFPTSREFGVFGMHFVYLFTCQQCVS